MDWGYVTGYFDGEGCVGIYSAKGKAKVNCSLAWFNNHRESLEAVQEFIGAGHIRRASARPKGCQTGYGLHVSRGRDMIRVARAMLPYSIIKRDKLVELLEVLDGRPEQGPNWGSLATAGDEAIRAAYWDEQLSQTEIAARYGVTQSAVKSYMQRNGIPVRSVADRHRLRVANLDPEKEAARARKLSATRREQWKDPVYREKVTAAIRASRK